MLVKNFEEKEKSTVSFDVEIDAEAFDKAIQSVYLKNRGKIFVAGFRKGKAPRSVVEGMYGKDVFYDDAADELAPEAFEFARDSEKLRAVGKPSVTAVDVAEDKTLTLSFLTAVWPKAELGEYKGLEAPRPAAEVTDEQVDQNIERTRKRNERVQDVDRAAANGDTAVIDYLGTVDGVPFDGGKAEGHELVLGSGSFIPGFEDQVVGMSAGEEKDIDVTFPEQYHAEDLAGKPAVFHVTCRTVREHILPELDDEFAKDVSEFDTLAEYRDSVRASLQSSADAEADEVFHSALLEKACDNMTVEIPDAMVESQLDRMMQEMDQNLAMQGLSLELYLRYLQTSLASFREQSRPGALARVRVEILLDAIAAAEGFTFTDEEIEAEYRAIADSYEAELDVVKQAVPVDAVTDDMKSKRAAAVIYDSAIATEPAAEPETPADEPVVEVIAAEEAPAEQTPVEE